MFSSLNLQKDDEQVRHSMREMKPYHT